MRRPLRWLMRCLAMVHFAWGLSLLLLAAWFAFSAFRILPHMSSGTVWRNLSAVLLMVMMQALPLGALGVWLGLLGRWIWTGHPQLRAALLATHGCLLLPGSLAIGIGVLALRAAARSAARGGGLMGSLGFFPLALGACVLALALGSIALALAVVPRQQVTETK